MDNHHPGVQSAVSLCRQMIMYVIFMLIEGEGGLFFSVSLFLYSWLRSKEIPRHKKLYLMQFVSFVYRTKRTRSLLSFSFISLCIIPNRWQSFVFISHEFWAPIVRLLA